MKCTPAAATVKTRSSGEPKEALPLSTVFDGGHSNFTHFTSTEGDLESTALSDLLHNLIRQQAALQPKFRQEDWDLLIPVYFGNMDQAFDPSRLSAILIQVTNRVKPSNLFAIVDFKKSSRFFRLTGDPILYILMDFGTPKVDCHAVGW